MTDSLARPTPRSADEVDRFVGGRIREIRKQRGLSQSQLGERLGVTFQQVQKYERGDNRVAASTVFRVCGVLKCGLADLFPPIDTGAPIAHRSEFDEPGARELAIAYAALSTDERRAFRSLAQAVADARTGVATADGDNA